MGSLVISFLLTILLSRLSLRRTFCFNILLGSCICKSNLKWCKDAKRCGDAERCGEIWRCGDAEGCGHAWWPKLEMQRLYPAPKHRTWVLHLCTISFFDNHKHLCTRQFFANLTHLCPCSVFYNHRHLCNAHVHFCISYALMHNPFFLTINTFCKSYALMQKFFYNHIHLCTSSFLFFFCTFAQLW